MATFDLQSNISTTEHPSSGGPNMHVIIIVGLIMTILLVLASILLSKYVSRLAYSWREKRAEEALTRAINIYNSQEPLEEPDLVYMRPGDQNDRRSCNGHRGESEIAFVHSDGRIERFRTHIGADRDRRESLTIRKQDSNKPEATLNTHDPQNRRVTRDEVAYTMFQPVCVQLNTNPNQCVRADSGDTVSLAGWDIPPPYEEALEMPGVINVNSPMIKNTDKFAVRGTLELDYYNIEKG